MVRFRVTITSGVTGDTITNTAEVTWNAATQRASASVSVDIGGILGSGILSGRAWHDVNFDNVFDSTELVLAGWTVQLYGNGTLLVSTLTDANGQYTFSGLVPNFGTSNQYEIRFRAPGAGPNTALLGLADSAFTNAPAAHLQHRRVLRQQSAGPQSADRTGRRGVQLGAAHAGGRIDAQPAAGGSGKPGDVRAGTRQLPRRCCPAGSGDTGERLLQVRHQFQRPRPVPEQRGLCHPGHAAGQWLRRRAVGDHPAGHERGHDRLLGATVFGRCDPGRLLRGPDLGIRARAQCPGRLARHGALPARDACQRQHSARQPAVQQPSADRPATGRGDGDDQPRPRRWSTSAAASWCRTRSRSATP
ncbi:MAG: hypothetical protein MZV70_41610 [Desulfobacterales bacterium]|nr:hypothetical protein [Desulfobacterales bacterium]